MVLGVEGGPPLVAGKRPFAGLPGVDDVEGGCLRGDRRMPIPCLPRSGLAVTARDTKWQKCKKIEEMDLMVIFLHKTKC